MPTGSRRSRTLRRVHVKSTQHTKIQYKKRVTSKKVCKNCRKVLSGIPNTIPSKFKTLPKTKKRPSRPYGGVLCSSCMRKEILKNV